MSNSWSGECAKFYAPAAPSRFLIQAFQQRAGDRRADNIPDFAVGDFEYGFSDQPMLKQFTTSYRQTTEGPNADLAKQVVNDVLEAYESPLKTYKQLLPTREADLTNQAAMLKLISVSWFGGYGGIAIQRRTSGQKEQTASGVGGLSVIEGSSTKTRGLDPLTTRSPSIPAELLLVLKNIKTPYFDYLRHKGTRLFELSKYNIDSLLSREDYDHVKKEIWKWFYRNYLADGLYPDDNVIFIMDVFSKKRRDSTIKNFGAWVLPRDFFSPPLRAPNYILAVDINTLRIKVRELIESKSP